MQSARRLITEGAVGDAALARLSETSEQSLAYDLAEDIPNVPKLVEHY